MARTALGLARACHPGPTLAVTAYAAAWALLGAGAAAGQALLVAAAVLAGQLSVGWCNDWVDAPADTAVGRTEKPVAAGLVTRRTVGVAALAALGACVVLSLALGLAAGLVHLLAVAAAWAYDLGLKSTVVSPLPYAVAFGLLPAVATLAVDGTWPAAGVLVATAALGVAAHLANTVPDTESDRLAGVRGLPQRMGPRSSLVAAGAALAVAAAALLVDGLAGPTARALLVAALALGLGVVVLARRPGARRGRAVFWAVVGAAGLVVAAVLVG
ncbi:UbiA family prenyltransferase [Aquipuribacter sp. SD81]|uniref:UbiA family prenyltransferase n=1 Tax=Aquipuribacter sp. SD81 TaxID=3127703 RepID=UPI00301B6870